MPSSPELAVQAWQPAELGAPPAPAGPARTALFEVSPATGIPTRLLEPARRTAQAAGYAAGWAHGIEAARLAGEAQASATRRRAEREADAARGRAEQAIAALSAAAEQLRERCAPTIEELEALVLDAAYTIAEAVVGATVRDDPQRGATALARVLGQAPAGVDEIEVALHPADLAALEVRPPGHVRLVPDADLQPGDATARCGAAAIDARLAAALARVRQVLGS